MKYGWLVATAVTALLLASCGGGSGSGTVESTASRSAAKPRVAVRHTERQHKLEHLDLTLAGLEGPESAGIVLADRNGYFTDAGLEVSVLTPVTPINSIEYVLNEFDDLGVAPEPQVVLAREKGFPIVAVGSLIPRPTAAMIWLGSSDIGGVEDLKGKTVAITGFSFQRDFLNSLLAQAGLTLKDVEVKTVGYRLVPSLVSGRADAIFGGSSNVEAVELESRGLHPVVTPLKDLGLPEYEQAVVIARRDRVSAEPKTIRRFMAAVRRGSVAAVKDPGAAADAIKAGDEQNPEASRKDTEAELERTLPLLSKAGRMSPRQARRLMAWMHSQGLIQQMSPVSSLLTNRYLSKP